MKKETVEGYGILQYDKIWKILEWRDGKIFKTEETEMWMKPTDEIKRSVPRDYMLCSPSTKEMKMGKREINVYESWGEVLTSKEG